MDTKIQELTEKIYQEGVEKGNEEAARIIAEAEARKKVLIEEAEAKAKEIVASAEKQANELKKNTEAELKLFASQSVEALKSEVTNLITGKVVSENVKAVAADPAFMQKVILELVKSWPSQENLVIQSADAEALKKYFLSNAKDLLNKGVTIEQVSGKKTSFQLCRPMVLIKYRLAKTSLLNFSKSFYAHSWLKLFSNKSVQ